MSHKPFCKDENCKECFEKSFASYPKSKYWSNKNKINPRDVFKSSHKKYWFNCDKCNHEFEKRLDKIYLRNDWCSYCTNKKICDNQECKECFEKSFVSHPKSQYWSNKNKINPRDVLKYSIQSYLFDCKKCNHQFNKGVYSIIRGEWCPYCSNKTLCDKEDCKECFEKSFASHPKSQCWSSKNKLRPREVFKSSHFKAWFNCDKCIHEFEQVLYTSSSDVWCPYCSSNRLCDKEDCKECFEKSFASHLKSQYWSSKNKLRPRDIFKYSNHKFWFSCDICTHEFEQHLNNTSRDNWCSYCSKKVLCKDENCKECFEKSFASYPKSQYWSNINKVTPRDVFKSSSNKYWFNCNKCNHKFEQKLYYISSCGTWCSKCINKTESQFLDYLISLDLNIVPQAKFDWCKKIRCLPFDFYLPDLNIIIEIDGIQHFEQVSNWDSPQDSQQNDVFKMEKAIEHNLTVIRLLQQEIYNDKWPSWKYELNKYLVKTSPKIIFLTQNSTIYENHINLIKDNITLIY